MVQSQREMRLDRRFIAFLLIFEAIFFFNYYNREVAWDVAENNDQAVFLQRSYRIQEKVMSDGLPALWKSLVDPHLQAGNGWLYPLEGTVCALVFGGARLPRLAVNFAAFAALQWVAFFTTRRMWKRRAYAYALLGLILAQNSLWFFAGGMFDFRMDFPAYCLYGIWTCAVLSSDSFLDRRWVVAAALVGALLTLNRYITFIYMAGASGLFGIFLLLAWFRARDAAQLGVARRRLGNLILGTGMMLAIVLPALFLNRGVIWDYYVVGHVTSGEKYIRLRGTGIVDATSYLLYYPRGIVRDHLGHGFNWAAPFGLICALVLRILNKRPAHSRAARSLVNSPRVQQVVFLICAILAPLTALTVDISKSPVVGSIVGIPVALLVVQIIAALTENLTADLSAVLSVAAALMFAIGAYKVLDKGATHGFADTYRPSIERLVQASDYMVKFSVDHGWDTPSFSCDTISGWYNNGTLNCLAYEHYAKLMDFRLMLGNVIYQIDREKALSQLADSDFAILSDPYRISGYPFTEAIAKYWPDLKAWCDQNMMAVDSFPFIGQILHLYVRPTAIVDGMIGGWIPARGIDLFVPTDALSRFPVIAISGLANPTVVSSATAALLTPQGPRELPTTFTHTGQAYLLRIDASSVDLRGRDTIRIHVAYAISVPAVPDQGIMPQPDRVALVREHP